MAVQASGPTVVACIGASGRQAASEAIDPSMCSAKYGSVMEHTRLAENGRRTTMDNICGDGVSHAC